MKPVGTGVSPTVTDVDTGYVNDAVAPLVSATTDASYGACPLASTKIVVVDGVPTHVLTTCTVDCGGAGVGGVGVGGVGVGVVGVVGGGAQPGAMVMVWAWVAVRPVESTTFMVKL